MSDPARTDRAPNRLIREKSPYLLQHAYNPVAWYPWGEEAFEKSRREQKPILLSIGYSTCHWCHVMERESFERAEIAELMNRWFVSIKVDREEYPDLDQVYMHAVTAMTGQGGWPLTVFLTPDLKPFFGGTYFPPERRGPLPGMSELLPAVAEAWASKREEVVRSAEQLTEELRRRLSHGTPQGTLTVQTLDEAFQQAAMSFDPSSGGFGGAPKFPRSHELSFLLHYWARTKRDSALDMVAVTLDHLARGGIHDHLGGGFHRYSTDAQWLVPHFEKMLYDQALLARTYLEAYRVTRRPRYAEVARGIFEYVLRDLTDPAGGFYAAEDADSEGVEGKFYVWTPEEVTEVLGQEDGELFCRFYGVTPEGNFSDPHHPVVGTRQSVLHIAQPLEDVATLKGREAAPLDARLVSGGAKLLAARSQRVRPHRDDKILTSWNGLMIGAFAYGAATLDEPRYLQAARRAADFLLGHLMDEGGLLRRYRDGEARYPGTLEDYAFFSYGLLELYEAGFEPRDLGRAKELAEQMVQRFLDERAGGFFVRSRQEPPLITPLKDTYDGATPSGNSMAALVLLRLGHVTGEERLAAHGRQALETFAGLVRQGPLGFPQMLIAWDDALGPLREIVIAAAPSDPHAQPLLRVLRERFLPRSALVLHPPGPERRAIEALVPFIQGQGPLRGVPTAYVCEGFQCRLPTTDPEILRRQLESVDQSARL